MKLLTWNCQGAFRKKYSLVAGLKPDLAVIQECEHPDKLTWKSGSPPSQILWFGRNRNRGVGVCSWTDLQFELSALHDDTIQLCLPIQITSPVSFHLVAVWAKDHAKSKLSYIAQVYQAIAAYRDFITCSDTLFLGDFNSNSGRDTKSKLGNHALVTNALVDLGMISAYHYIYREKPGKETRATFFMGRNHEKPFHIDYAFIPTRWLRRLKTVRVGDPLEWLEYSDHMPLYVEFIPPPD